MAPVRSRPPAHVPLVLLAEDDAAVRQLLTIGLEDAGYRVLAAGDGREALDLFLAHSGEICAAVVDLVLPGLPGERAVAEMWAVRSDLPVVLMTGYSHLHPAMRLIERGPAGFLRKPFTIQTFLAALSDLSGVEPLLPTPRDVVPR